MQPAGHQGFLSPEQVRQFYDQGFIVLDQLFEEISVRKLRAAFEALKQLALSKFSADQDHIYKGSRFVMGRHQNQTIIQRIVWCGGAAPALREVGRASVLPWIAAQLLGSERVDHLINQAHFKNPGDGVAFPWHQDSSNRRYGTQWSDVNGKGSYVQVALALDDHTLENGPLQFIPGSSKLGHLGLENEDVQLKDYVDLSSAVSLEMKAGSVVLFGPYVVHSSQPNRSDHPRRTLINGYAYPGANRRIYPGCGLGVPINVPYAIAT